MDLQRGGNPRQAEIIYADVLAEQPGQPDALHMLGLIAFQRGDHKSAIASIRQAIQHAPAFPDAYNSLGIVLKRVGETEEAVDCYRRAITLRQDYPEAHRNLAIALEALGRIEEAEQAVMDRLSLTPDDASAHIDLGFVHHKKGQIDDAIAAFRRAIELDPGNANARRNLWVSYTRGGRFEDAEKALRDWQAYDPDNPIAQHMLAAFSGADTPARASDAYVQQMFARMAPGFDRTLADLGYRAPELVTRALAALVGPPSGELDILDAGCGTGLCGPLLRAHARSLTGVDLSEAMLTHAETRGSYDGLLHAELTAFLSSPPGLWDAIVSADTLCYFGDLAPVLTAAAGALSPLGCLIFTVERLDEEADFKLHRHGRYSHGEHYVRRTVAAAKLELRALGFETLRLEGGKPVAGLVVTAVKPAQQA